jgi:hypothetical protein
MRAGMLALAAFLLAMSASRSSDAWDNSAALEDAIARYEVAEADDKKPPKAQEAVSSE